MGLIRAGRKKQWDDKVKILDAEQFSVWDLWYLNAEFEAFTEKINGKYYVIIPQNT